MRIRGCRLIGTEEQSDRSGVRVWWCVSLECGGDSYRGEGGDWGAGTKGKGDSCSWIFAVVLSALKERRGDNKEERGSSSRKFSSVHSISQEDVG